STERAAEAPAEAPVETNAAAVEERADAELIGCSGGHVDPTGRSCWHDPSAVCFCQCHASQAAAPAEVETPAPATTRPFWAKPSANKVLPPSGGRTYFFSQVARAAAPDRKSTRLNSSHEWISYAVFCLQKKMNSGPASQIAPGQVQSPLPSIESRWISCDRYGCGLGYIGQVRR